ncbi:TonB-dependent receptor [Mucilaginibacter corticis]|uniref:TonB-dependent receptor n=1 Tax=Mucilaginibacter corticis TaxID=2597670 RepID=A0A556MKQ1_9SPHI|nr:outer membrane beta-barrel protein [Mucilaginibacter corticis]TSJ40497.1 TonB-dependent receptor [Mucilaginibacter corticis]
MKTFIAVLTTAWACFVFNFANAQITGHVVNGHNKGVNGATVMLLTAKDSAVAKPAVTLADGSFSFTPVKGGLYRVNISTVGYQNYKGAIFNVGDKAVVLPVIVIEDTSKTLKEVEVVAKKAFIEQKIDRTVVNVGTSISNTGANALEALEKAPGVTVDDNGQISLKGKSGVLVLIDDRPTYLSGEDLANYLKAMPASQLDQIELMSNPPAKYDASGNSGVINIKTKKSKIRGFNGSFAASAGKAQYWRTLESLNLNYHTGKTNWFALAGYGIQKNYRRLDVGRTYLDADHNVTSSYSELAYFHPVNYNPNLKMGMDYYLSPKTTIGFVLTGTLSSGDNYNPVSSVLQDNAGRIDSLITSKNDSHTKNYSGGINLNFSHQFDSLGKVLTFDLDYLKYNNNRDQTFFNNTYNSAGMLGGVQDITDHLPANINIYAAKTDYVQPLPGKAKLSFGLKASYVNTDNSANYFNIIDNVSVVDNNNTNRFLYRENIDAAYAGYNQEFKRFTLQAGLRVEHTNVNGHQLGNAQAPDSSFTQHYTGLFPTTYLLYKLDSAGSNTLKLSYGRRIDRPYYQDLNPFKTILDKYSSFEGNPFLKPQYSSDYQLMYSYKSIFSAGVEYNPTYDYQVEYDSQRGSTFSATSINLGKRVFMGLEVNLNLDPVKWWNFSLHTELNRTSYQGQLIGSYLNNSSTYCYLSNNNQFDLSNGWNAEVFTFYLSPTRDAQFTHVFREQTNVGLSKKILNNKATVKLSARDIFRANFSGGNITNIPNVIATYHNDFSNRSVTLGFTYNFGSNKNDKKKPDTNNAADDEAGRVRN